MPGTNHTQRINPLEMSIMPATSVGTAFHKVGDFVASDAVENVGTDTILVADAHSVAALDILVMYTGGEAHESLEVASITTDLITLAEALSGAPSAAEEFAAFTPDVTDAVETPTSTSTTVLGVGNHGVTAKDFLIFSDGDEESEPRHAESVGADDVTVVDALSGTPSAGEKFSYKTPDTVDAAEGGTTDTVIAATAHTASTGDVLYFLDGGESAEVRSVASTATNTITLDAALSGAPSAAEEFAFWTPTATGAVEASTTDTVITDADHAAAVDDIFIMTSGGEIDEPRIVLSITGTTFTLNEALSGTPTAAETYSLTTATGTEQIDAAISTTNLHAIDHAAVEGDLVLMVDGGETGEMRAVLAVPARNDITLNEILSGTPSAAEEFILLSGTPDALDANVISTTVIPAVAHGASSGDLFIMDTGGEESEPRLLTSSTTDDLITVDAALSGTPSAAETFVTLAATGSDAVEAGTTDTILNASSHVVVAGDLVLMSSGGELDEPRIVTSTETNTITLDSALSGTPSATETFSFFRGDAEVSTEAGTTDTIITDANHRAVVGDIFSMTSGGEVNELRVVLSLTSSTFTLNEALSGTPTATETYRLFSSSVADVIEAGQTDTTMIAKSHGSAVNDLFMLYTGGEESEVRHVTAVSTDTITLDTALSGAPSAAEKFTTVTPDVTDVLDTNESTTKIFATAHVVAVGDILVMTSGGEDGQTSEVSAVTVDSMTLITALTGTPTASETFSILRPILPKRVRMLTIDNGTNERLILSVDGVTKHLTVPATSRVNYDLGSNGIRLGNDNTDFTDTNTQRLHVKYETSAPTTGSVYFEWL